MSADSSTGGDVTSSHGDSSESGEDELCGDGRIQADEECDDGDQTNGNGCNNNCELSGKLIWERHFAPDSGFFSARGLLLTPDGDVMVFATHEDSGGTDWWRRYSSEGEVLETLDPPEPGGLIIGYPERGGTLRILDGGFELYSESGVQQWRTPFDFQLVDWATSASGEVLAVGHRLDSAFNDTERWVELYASDGTSSWQDLVDTEEAAFQGCTAAALHPDGTVIAVCTRAPDEPQEIRKYSLTGELYWADPIGPSDATIMKVRLHANEDIAVAGLVEDQGFFVSRYNPEGVVEWRRDVSPLDRPYFADLELGPDETSYVFGHEFVNEPGDSTKRDPSIVKSTGAGLQLWRATYSGELDVQAAHLAVDSEGFAYALGDEEDGLVLLKYSP